MIGVRACRGTRAPWQGQVCEGWVIADVRSTRLSQTNVRDRILQHGVVVAPDAHRGDNLPHSGLPFEPLCCGPGDVLPAGPPPRGMPSKPQRR